MLRRRVKVDEPCLIAVVRNVRQLHRQGDRIAPDRREIVAGRSTSDQLDGGHNAGRDTPTTDVHEPDSTYAQFYLVPVIGPLSYLTWQRLNLYLPVDDAQVPIAHDEFAWSLEASLGRLNRAITRLVKFHLAYLVPAEPDMLYVNRRVPTLSPVLLAGLALKCPTLAGAHAEQLDAA